MEKHYLNSWDVKLGDSFFILRPLDYPFARYLEIVDGDNRQKCFLHALQRVQYQPDIFAPPKTFWQMHYVPYSIDDMRAACRDELDGLKESVSPEMYNELRPDVIEAWRSLT